MADNDNPKLKINVPDFKPKTSSKKKSPPRDANKEQVDAHKSSIEPVNMTLVEEFLDTSPYAYLSAKKETNTKLIKHCEKILEILNREDKIFDITGTILKQVKLLSRFQDLSINFNSREILAEFRLAGNPNYRGNKAKTQQYSKMFWKEYVETDGVHLRRNLIIDTDFGQILMLNDVDPTNSFVEVNENNLKLLYGGLGHLMRTDEANNTVNMRRFLSTFICNAIDLLQQDLDEVLEIDQETFSDPYGLKISLRKPEVPSLLQVQAYTTYQQNPYENQTNNHTRTNRNNNINPGRGYNNNAYQNNYSKYSTSPYNNNAKSHNNYNNKNNYRSKQNKTYNRNKTPDYNRGKGDYRKTTSSTSTYGGYHNKKQNSNNPHKLQDSQQRRTSSKRVPFATFDKKYLQKHSTTTATGTSTQQDSIQSSNSEKTPAPVVTVKIKVPSHAVSKPPTEPKISTIKKAAPVVGVVLPPGTKMMPATILMKDPVIDEFRKMKKELKERSAELSLTLSENASATSPPPSARTSKGSISVNSDSTASSIPRAFGNDYTKMEKNRRTNSQSPIHAPIEEPEFLLGPAIHIPSMPPHVQEHIPVPPIVVKQSHRSTDRIPQPNTPTRNSSNQRKKHNKNKKKGKGGKKQKNSQQKRGGSSRNNSSRNSSRRSSGQSSAKTPTGQNSPTPELLRRKSSNAKKSKKTPENAQVDLL